MKRTTIIFTLDEVYYSGDGDDTDNNLMHNINGTLYSRLLYCDNLSHNLRSHIQVRPHSLRKLWRSLLWINTYVQSSSEMSAVSFRNYFSCIIVTASWWVTYVAISTISFYAILSEQGIASISAAGCRQILLMQFILRKV